MHLLLELTGYKFREGDEPPRFQHLAIIHVLNFYTTSHVIVESTLLSSNVGNDLNKLPVECCSRGSIRNE